MSDKKESIGRLVARCAERIVKGMRDGEPLDNTVLDIILDAARYAADSRPVKIPIPPAGTEEPTDVAYITGWNAACDAFSGGNEPPEPLIVTLTKPDSIDMVLHCPVCRFQHIDEPEPCQDEGGWTNPPHRSHLCGKCGHVWRPADVPTNGVSAIKTKGRADSPPNSAQICCGQYGTCREPCVAREDARVAAAQSSDDWRAAILDQLAAHSLDAPMNEPPATTLRRIIDMAVTIAIDPRVSDSAPPA